MSEIGPITYYLHDDYSGEEHDEWVDDLVEKQPELAPHADVLKRFFASRPFYEIALDLYVDTDTEEARLAAVYKGGFKPLQEET